jgi:hypothetical protein
MSSRSLSKARPDLDIDSVMKIFFLLLDIPRPLPCPGGTYFLSAAIK